MKFNTRFVLIAALVIAASILYTQCAKISVNKNNNVLNAEGGLDVSNSNLKVLKKVEKKKKKKKTDPAPAAATDLYSITILGDIGQFEYFKKLKNANIPEFGEGPEISAETCKTLITAHTKANDLMVNFETLLKEISARPELKSDDAAILGDSIYVEKKGGGNDLETLRKVEPKIVSPHQLIKDADIINSKFNIDSEVDIKSKDDAVNKKILELRDREKRLLCGWYYLKNNIFKTNAPDWLNKSIQFINGNHTYDIDYKFEASYVSSNLTPSNSFNVRLPGGKFQERNKDPLSPEDYLRPRVVKANSSNVDIHYIDLDPSLLTCSDKLVFTDSDGKPKFRECTKPDTDFVDCIKNRQAKANMPILDDVNKTETCNVHLNYLKETLEVLKDVIADQSAVWRIARMHQPIFNVEYDYAGMKLNKLLMEQFKKSHIHAWFVSHFHNAQFTVSLYEQSSVYKYNDISNFDYKTMQNKYSAIRGKITVKEQSPDAHTSLGDFLSTKTGFTDKFNSFNKTMSSDGTSIDGIVANYPYVSWVDRSSNVLKNNSNDKGKKNSVVVAKCNEEFVFQFLTGNSGRVLDPLFNDQFSDLMLIFGQAYTGQHGFTRFRFYKTSAGDPCLEGSFYILNKDQKLPKDPVYVQEICQTFVKEDCKATERFKVLTEANFKSNGGKNVVLDHLSKVVDPFGKDVEIFS